MRAETELLMGSELLHLLCTILWPKQSFLYTENIGRESKGISRRISSGTREIRVADVMVKA